MKHEGDTLKGIKNMPSKMPLKAEHDITKLEKPQRREWND
jgi:hypothetical protein